MADGATHKMTVNVGILNATVTKPLGVKQHRMGQEAALLILPELERYVGQNPYSVHWQLIVPSPRGPFLPVSTRRS